MTGLCFAQGCVTLSGDTRSGSVLCTPDGTWSTLPLLLGKLLSVC